MKKAKPNEASKQSDFSDNVLKYQNTFLATQVDLLKRELLKAQLESNPSIALPVPDESEEYYKKLCHHLARRIRIITAYNKQAIEKKQYEPSEEIRSESFECICGGNQIQAIKYELIQNYEDTYNQFVKSDFQIDEQMKEQVEQQSQDNNEPKKDELEQPRKPSPPQGDAFKDVLNQLVEEKSQLLQQMEDLKISYKLSEEQFYQSSLFSELVQQNNALTSNIFTLEDQVLQCHSAQQEQIDKHRHDILALYLEQEVKLKDMLDISTQSIRQEPIQLENIQQPLIDGLNAQIQGLEKIVQDMKVEMQQQRSRNSELQTQLLEEVKIKQSQAQVYQELRQTVNAEKNPNSDEKMEFMTLRYDKHKTLLYEIEQDYVNQKSGEFIQRFREFIGYVKMRDDKVRGLEQLVELRNQDNAQMKKQMQSVFDELDYNGQVSSSQMEYNQTLKKLLDETQKNESRAMKEKSEERFKFEQEKQLQHQKLQQAEEVIRSQQTMIEQQKKLLTMIEQERQSNRETLRQSQKSEQLLKQQLVQRENDILQRNEELKIFFEREKLSDSINLKYIKSSEKSKAKQKLLKLQMKCDNKDSGNELVESMKMMVNCQQCKKRIKQVVLIKCLHMFCKPCIDDNQKNRNRACPVCRSRYGIEDVKNIKFN